MPKHIPYMPGQIYFITSNVWKRQPVFLNENNVRLLLTDFDFYRKKFGYLIYAWVIMPDHFHWLIKPSATDFKQFCNDQAQRKGKYHQNPSLYYLSHIMESLKSHSAQVINKKQMVHLWQAGFHDKLIRYQKALQAAIHYIHNNPIKSGLVDDVSEYSWSSYRSMYLGENEILRLVIFRGQGWPLYDFNTL